NNVFSYTWTGVTNGTYAVFARATDTNNGTARSAMVGFTVRPTNSFPTVSITSPTNGATIESCSSFTIQASASDSDGIARVDFYEGTNFLGSDFASPYTLVGSSWSPGTHVLTAKAVDNYGAKSASAPVQITVGEKDPASANGY